jgi:3-oxoacyl-[acyl-carrier protein] reductase
LLDDVEEALPEGALRTEPAFCLCERPRVEAKAMCAPLDHADDQTGLLEDAHVARHRRLRDTKAASRIVNRGRAKRETLDELAPEWVSQGVKRTVSHYANNPTRLAGLSIDEGGPVLLEDKNAVIYGGGGPIGGAVARAFAREGASVHLAGRRVEPLQALAAEINGAGGAATVASLDALDEHAVDSHAADVVARAGSIDISLNVISHGEVFGTPLADMALADFERPIHTATRSTFLTARAAARHMIPKRSGVILMFGGYGQPLLNSCIGGFQVGLTAVDALRRQLAAELGPHGIRVVTLQSVGIPESHASDGDGTPPRLLERAPTLTDVGNVAVFTASDHAAAITGTAINITCGAEVD